MSYQCRHLLLALLLTSASALPSLAARDTFYAVGAAGIDITPEYPIRLSGYGARQKESEGIDQHLFAKALAIGSSKRTAEKAAALELLTREGVASGIDG